MLVTKNSFQQLLGERTEEEKRLQVKAFGIYRVCIVIAALAVVGLIAAGCGSSSSSSTGEESGSAPSGEPVKLGMIANQAELGTFIAVVESSVDALNKRGGLEGRPVELVYCDDKSDPNVTTTCGRKMVEEEVMAIVGGGAINGHVLVPLFEKAEIPSIGVETADPAQSASKDYFFFKGGESSEVIAAYSGQAGLKTSLLAVEVPETQAYIAPDLKAAKETGNPIQNVVEVPMGQADYSPIIASAKPDEANAAMLVVAPPQEGPLVQTALTQGWSPTWLIGTEPSVAVAEAFGGTVTDTVYASPFPPLTPESEDESVLQYLEDLEVGVEEGVEHANEALAHPTYTEAQGWLAVHVVEQLVEEGKVKELTAPALLSALSEVDGLDIGLLKSWVPNETGPDGFRGGNDAYNVIEVNEGKLVSLTKEPVTTEELVSGKVTVPPPASAE